VPQAEILGAKIPDANLKWNEDRKHYDFGEIDWEEFWQVVNGHGKCNKLRLEARRSAWEKGTWVRDAAMAHAEKQTQRNLEKAV
jgi:ring-1,2-phenylacetyl-CoA epoxidase subunit PaaA